MRDRLRLDQDPHDRGAVAVIVALMAVVLVGMAAFAVDFGVAYANKTSLQKAADAAALGAAGKIIRLVSSSDDCTAISAMWSGNTGGFQTTVQSTADTIAVQNTPISTRTGMDVKCSTDGKRVEVSYSNTGSTSSIFGGLFGVSTLSASRTATADIYAAPDGVGLRPYALCTADADALVTASTSATKWVGVAYPNAACGNYGGNWYTLNCPEDGNNGTLDTTTLYGCKDDVGIIPQVDSAGVPLSTGTIDASIVKECTDISGGTVNTPADCLLANPGNVRANNVVSAWDVLLTKPSIMIPIFDPVWNTYSTTMVKGCTTGGNNGCYPVKALASVKVCGYAWGNKTGWDTTSIDPGEICAGVDTAVQALKGPTDELWLALTTGIQTTGSSSPGGIAVGHSYGVYGTRLIQ